MRRRSNRLTTKSESIQSIVTPKILHEVFTKGLRALNRDEMSDLIAHLLNVVNQSIGLKASSPPNNVHKDVMRRYIKEVFELDAKNIKLLMDKVVLEGEKIKPVLKYVVKNGSNIIAKNDGTSSPYFRLFVPGLPDQVFTSRPLLNNRHPQWNVVISFSIDPKLINSDQEIIFELWDKNIFSLNALANFFRVKTFSSILQGIQNVFFYFLSFIMPINFDQRVGFVSLSLNQIPSTEWHITSTIVDSYGNHCGYLNLALSWSANELNWKNTHFTQLVRHIEIVSYFIHWHSFNLLSQTVNFHDFPGLFYLPAICLMNQNRLQSNLTTEDHEIILHSVACMVLCNNLTDSEQSEKIRLIMLSFIASLNPPKAVVHFTGSTREVFLHVLNDIIEYLLRGFLKILKRSKGNAMNGKSLEFALFLKIFDRYDKTFTISCYRKRLNIPIAQHLVAHIQDNLSNYKSWPKLVDQLDVLNDITCKNWSQSLATILGRDGLKEVRRTFSSGARDHLANSIKTWKSDEKKYYSLLFDAYSLIRKMDKILFLNLVTETDPITNYVVYKEKLFEDVRRRKGKWVKQVRSDNLINRAKKVSTSSESIKNIDNFAPYLPQSITGFVEMAQKQLKSKPTERIVETTQVALSEQFEFKDKSKEISGLMKVFPNYIEIKWLPYQEKKIKLFIGKFINSELVESQSIADAATKSGQLYYEIMSESMYFYANCYCWDLKTFEIALNLFIESLQYFYANFFEELKKKVKQSNDNDWIVFGLNFLSTLRDRYLRRNFVESLTYILAEDVWNWILSYLELRPLDIFCSPSETSVFLHKIDALNFPSSSKAVALACVRIDSICNELSGKESTLIDLLILKMFIMTKNLINDETSGKNLFASVDEHYFENVRQRFGSLLGQILDILEAEDVRATFIIGLRYNLVRYSKTKINQISQINRDERKSSREIEIKLVRASIIAEKMIELLITRLYELDLIDYYLKERIETSLESKESLSSSDQKIVVADSINVSNDGLKLEKIISSKESISQVLSGNREGSRSRNKNKLSLSLSALKSSKSETLPSIISPPASPRKVSRSVSKLSSSSLPSILSPPGSPRLKLPAQRKGSSQSLSSHSKEKLKIIKKQDSKELYSDLGPDIDSTDQIIDEVEEIARIKDESQPLRARHHKSTPSDSKTKRIKIRSSQRVPREAPSYRKTKKYRTRTVRKK